MILYMVNVIYWFLRAELVVAEGRASRQRVPGGWRSNVSAARLYHAAIDKVGWLLGERGEERGGGGGRLCTCAMIAKSDFLA